MSQITFNRKDYPATGFTSSSGTSILAGTVIHTDEIVSKIGINVCQDVGAANALVAYVTDIAGGVAWAPDIGTTVIVKTANALQAGANTFNFNGHGTDSIFAQHDKGNNLTSVIAAGAMLMLIYDGDNWQAVGW